MTDILIITKIIFCFAKGVWDSIWPELSLDHGQVVKKLEPPGPPGLEVACCVCGRPALGRVQRERIPVALQLAAHAPCSSEFAERVSNPDEQVQL